MALSQHSADAHRGYPDLHEHLESLEKDGLLVRVERPMNKDTEIHPLVRWQFRGGIPEPERKAFLFEHVVDSKGKKYDMKVAVGILASSREIYARGMGCKVEEIGRRWQEAKANPIPPIVVDEAPCQEVVHIGDDLDRPGGGLDMLPCPLSTPGFDNGPYLSAGHTITKDPETGVQNAGNYRCQIKSPRKMGMNTSVELMPGALVHWEKNKAKGEHTPCAVVVGAPPIVSMASVQKLPYDMDEFAVAGALAGSPVRMVKCKTNDILVPADAEIVIEGYIDKEWMEPEAPFGESHGHVNLMEYNHVIHVTAITHKRNAIFTSIISQVTPSESSLIKKVAFEPLFTEHLRNTLGIQSVVRVVMHEPLTNLRKVVAVVMKDPPEAEVWRALNGICTLHQSVGKIVIAVNEDIDPENPDALLWAMSYRMRPHLDMQVIKGRNPGHGPREFEGLDSSMLINATLKGPFPPISLPAKEYMERAKVIWEELGLPPLKPEAPWHGYTLGDWSDKFEEMAQAAVRGDYFETYKELEKLRRNDVEPNTPLRMD